MPGDRANSPQHRTAFTLVELLVVISIIALLLAVLMPALAKVREQSRRVVCGANDKQIGLLLELYCGDNRGSYMPAYSAWYHFGSCNYDMNNDGKADQWGLLAVMPYIFKKGFDAKGDAGMNRMKIFWCPSGKSNTYNELQWKGTAFANFGYNQYCSRTSQDCDWGGRTQNILEHCPLKNTSKGNWITFTDICYLGIPGTSTVAIQSNHPKTTLMGGNRSKQTATTAAGGNSLHVDGHVEWNNDKKLNTSTTNIQVKIDPGAALGNPAYWLYPRTP